MTAATRVYPWRAESEPRVIWLHRGPANVIILLDSQYTSGAMVRQIGAPSIGEGFPPPLGIALPSGAESVHRISNPLRGLEVKIINQPGYHDKSF